MKPLLSLYLVLFSAFALASNDFSSVYQRFQAAHTNGDHATASELAKQAYQLGIEKFGADSENALNLLYNLGNARLLNNQYEQALESYDALLTPFITLHGEQSQEVYELRLQRLKSMSKISISKGKPLERAYRNEGQTLFRLAEVLSEKEPEQAPELYFGVINILSSSIKLPLKRNRVIAYAETTESLLLDKFGESDNRTLKTQFYLGQLYSGKKARLAIDKFESLVGTLRGSLDYTHPYELAAHAQLVSLYEMEEQSEKATEHCMAIGRMTPWDDDIKPVPLYRVHPQYPKNTRMREGMVKMAFDISPTGFVENIQVLDSEGGKGFEDESIAALSEWRYAPKFEDGQAVTAKGQTVQLDFVLERRSVY
ncbi:TonB family protein [Alteromonas sediminis]|uniref:TonB family protein n=1 Tax=Alteromonas sediminis TaxID=2259342 RepID=A0A3N5Y2E7_9ALTE|nr:TonB family protein [Alteromonas sediminis]RPJ67530.1 TonB family protein [Alteromonas sediminis]